MSEYEYPNRIVNLHYKKGRFDSRDDYLLFNSIHIEFLMTKHKLEADTTTKKKKNGYLHTIHNQIVKSNSRLADLKLLPKHGHFLNL